MRLIGVTTLHLGVHRTPSGRDGYTRSYQAKRRGSSRQACVPSPVESPVGRLAFPEGCLSLPSQRLGLFSTWRTMPKSAAGALGCRSPTSLRFSDDKVRTRDGREADCPDSYFRWATQCRTRWSMALPKPPRRSRSVSKQRASS
jgi:hypothetical protein